MATDSIAAVILAAGESRRMGQPKQLLPFRGRTLVGNAIATALASTCRPIVVTIGACEDRMRRELQALPVVVSVNREWREGLSSTLRLSVRTLREAAGPALAGAVFMLADQPLVTGADIDTLVAVHHRTGKDIVASEYADVQGAPMFISSRLFAEVAALRGHTGAKQLIERHVGGVAVVPLPGAAIDVDTPGDYETLTGEEMREGGH
jgi:molybdenum cofactor cytidylyltransferase